jgi:hypothetical protein
MRWPPPPPQAGGRRVDSAARHFPYRLKVGADWRAWEPPVRSKGPLNTELRGASTDGRAGTRNEMETP